MASRDAVAEVRERTDIVELVSGYAPLKRAGRSYKGLCPFHQEKTPSFVVFPESGNFHCFGCGKGGDVFSFYMGVEHVEFREALTELARRAGVDLPNAPTVAPEVDAHRERLIELNELAAGFFNNVLVNSQAGTPGREVVAQRGLSPDVIQRFGIGYALDQWDALLRYLASRGVDPALAAEAGLLQTRDSGGHYDRFRNRLMFPIRTREGRVVGFGARALGDAQPKYLNSPQSAIFDKSGLVYALDLAKDEIRRRDQVVVVEGYMDAIAAHQFGHPNVVAAMGTAVTEAQIGLIKRMSRHIVLALDADAAGQAATLRSLESLPGVLTSGSEGEPDGAEAAGLDARDVLRLEQRLKADVSIVRLPDGKDPDELIRRAPERWPEVIATAQPFLDFVVDAVAATVDPNDAAAKSAAAARVGAILRGVGDEIVQSHYAKLLAHRLNVSEESVTNEMRRSAIRRPRSFQSAPSPSAGGRATPVSHEDHLLALLLKHRPLLTEVLPDVPSDEVLDGRNQALLAVLGGGSVPADLTPEAIVALLDDALADQAQRLLTTLASTPAQYPGEIERDARQTLERLRLQRHTFLMRRLQEGIATAQLAGDGETVGELSGQLAALASEGRAFAPRRSPYFRDLRDPQQAATRFST